MSDIIIFILFGTLIILVLFMLILILASCKVASKCDYYDEKTLDDDITMDLMMESLEDERNNRKD